MPGTVPHTTADKRDLLHEQSRSTKKPMVRLRTMVAIHPAPDPTQYTADPGINKYSTSTQATLNAMHPLAMLRHCTIHACQPPWATKQPAHQPNSTMIY